MRENHIQLCSCMCYIFSLWICRAFEGMRRTGWVCCEVEIWGGVGEGWGWVCVGKCTRRYSLMKSILFYAHGANGMWGWLSLEKSVCFWWKKGAGCEDGKAWSFCCLDLSWVSMWCGKWVEFPQPQKGEITTHHITKFFSPSSSFIVEFEDWSFHWNFTCMCVSLLLANFWSWRWMGNDAQILPLVRSCEKFPYVRDVFICSQC